MSAVYVSNIIVYTHTDFEQTFVLEDATSNSALNLENYTGSSQFRKYGSSSVAGTFNTQITNTLLGKVKIELNANQTKSLKAGKYFYDILMTDGNGDSTRVVEGTLIIKKAITR